MLNYKSIPYKTHWLEYPDIEPHFKSLSIPPNQEGTPYTIPAITLPDGTHVMDSQTIALALEKRYPNKSVHLDSPYVDKVGKLIPGIMGTLTGVCMPLVPRTILNPRSAKYFEETRAVKFGMPLSQLEKEKGGESAWEEAKPVIQEAGKLLKENDGPFFLGKEVSYADCMILGILQFAKQLGGGIFEKMVDIEPALAQMYEASAEWLKRDDR